MKEPAAVMAATDTLRPKANWPRAHWPRSCETRVRDVVAHLRVSRRLADLRYRELANESIYQTIMRLRLEKARALLTSTSLTVAKVIARCGFPDANCAARTFKRRFGVTMGRYGKARPGP